MNEKAERIDSIQFKETEEFKAKKRHFFIGLGRDVYEVLKLHKAHGLWERKPSSSVKANKKDWGNVSDHCLVEVARAEVFGEKLNLSEETVRDLKSAAALHDFYKRNDIEAMQEALKLKGVTESVLENQARKELEVMRDNKVSEDIIYIKEGVGGEKWVQELILKILGKQGPLSQKDIACLVLHYIDDYTRDVNWALLAEVTPGGKKINELDRRIDKNEANPNYKRFNEEGVGWFQESETPFQLQRRIGHLVESKIAEIIKERSGQEIDPLDLPEFIDNEIRKKIESI